MMAQRAPQRRPSPVVEVPAPRLVATADPRRNRLLAALPEADWRRWAPQLEAVSMPLGQLLYSAGAVPGHAYFPTTATASLQYVTESGAAVELAQTGFEGMVGVPLFMGGGSTPSQAVVQSAGAGLRISAAALREEFARGGAVVLILLRFTQALIAQVAQTAACNRHHSVLQQLCRWLLMSLDRSPGNELVATQERIAQMLGVRREGVTEAALQLQRDGRIHYRRGHIAVLDRAGLERQSCECYAVVRKEYERLLGGG